MATPAGESWQGARGDDPTYLFAPNPEEETDFVVDANRKHFDSKCYFDEQISLMGERAAARIHGG